MKVLVVGAGMYVTGRDGTGVGTVLSSLAQSSRDLPIEEVLVVARHPESARGVFEAGERINACLGTSLKVGFHPLSGAEDELLRLCRAGGFDCAIVAVPDHLHFEVARQILLADCHCLVVKPLTPTLAEARELEELARERKLFGCVELHKRYDETNLYIKRAIGEGRLGKLDYFLVEYSQKISIPAETFRGWADRSNIFQYLGVHYVDLIYFLTGFLPLRAMAVGTTGVLAERAVTPFDSVHATVIWQSPVEPAQQFVSQFATNWIDPVGTSALSDQKYKVIGTKGRFDCDQKNRGLEMVLEHAGICAVNPYFSEYLPDEEGRLTFGGYGHKSINLFLLDVIAIRAGKRTPSELDAVRPSFRQALVSSAVVEAVNLSLGAGGSWKDINAIS